MTARTRVSMTALLAPPLTTSLASPASDEHRGRWEPVAITHGPVLARTRGMSRWHRVRSGLHYPARPPHPDASRMGWSTETIPAYTVWQHWCGTTSSERTAPRRGAAPGVLLADALPGDGTPLCGTCEGRAVGAGYLPAGTKVTAPDGLLHSPRTLDPPPVCPGSRRDDLQVEVPEERASDCLVCGQRVGWWGRGLRRHPPGSGLVPGCPRHAWSSLVVVDDLVVCACRTYYARG